MGKKFIITENERNRIKGLYEQEITNDETPNDVESTDELSIDSLMFSNIKVYGITVRKGQYNDGVEMKIKLNTEGKVVGTKITENITDNVTDEEAIEYVMKLSDNNHFVKAPYYFEYDLKTGKHGAE